MRSVTGIDRFSRGLGIAGSFLGGCSLFAVVAVGVMLTPSVEAQSGSTIAFVSDRSSTALDGFEMKEDGDASG